MNDIKKLKLEIKDYCLKKEPIFLRSQGLK